MIAAIDMSTVYVFGAGASVDAGYPLTSTMGIRLLEYMRSSNERQVQTYAEHLTENFGEQPNIEDLITRIHSQIVALQHSRCLEERAKRTTTARRRDSIVFALKGWFRLLQSSPAPSYAIFANSIVKRSDTVITFNYDISIERELRQARIWDLSGGYGFPLGYTETPSDVRVLKLHDSVNWLISFFDGAIGGTTLVGPTSSMGNHPVILEEDRKNLGYEGFSGHTYTSGGGLPCLILPGRSKEFFYDTSFGREFEDFWNSLWAQAEGALKAADKIVICGYSLPEADQRARDLLLQRPRRDIAVQILSGSQSEPVADEFRSHGFKFVSAFPGGRFAEWCKAQPNMSGTAVRPGEI